MIPIKDNTYLPMFFLRRRDVELESSFEGEDSPFKALEKDYGIKFVIEKQKKYCKIYLGEDIEVEDKEGNVEIQTVANHDLFIGYAGALSTFATIRGLGFDDVETIIFDEFIKEPHVHKIKREAQALWNLYESINRNRELVGRPAAKLICLANANDIANDYYLDLGVVNEVEKMEKSEMPFKQWIDRGLTILNIGKDSPISQKKKHTALYKLTEGTDFYKMAVENKFNEDDSEVIKPQDLRNYNPVCASTYGFVVYKRKGLEIHDGSNKQMYYISPHMMKGIPKYGRTQIEKHRFIRKYAYLWYAFIESRVIFEDYLCIELFQKMFDTTDD